MHFRRKMIVSLSAALCAASLLGPATQAEDLKAAYSAQISWTLHLLETGRYGESVDAAQSLIAANPDRAMPYELRAATALYVGSTGRAQKDFAHAAALSSDPEALYGLALCALFGRKADAAANAWTQAAASPDLSETQSRDISTAQAYVKFLKGDFDGAEKAGDEGDTLREEIGALAESRKNPRMLSGRLAKLLAQPSGVPKLREEDGLRPLFDAARPLEPCVVEPDLQQMYADRLLGDVTDTARQVGTVLLCSGMATLTPAEAIPRRAALVSYTVDGQMAAVVSQSPYEFSWNTAHVVNGTHQVRIDSVDASGNDLTTQLLTVRVNNKNGTLTNQVDTSPEAAALRARLWNLLKLRPSWKVAEWTLAQGVLAGGDRTSADAHLAIAAALDPAYKNGQQFAQTLFAAPASVYWTGNTTRKEIALTFDDGPNPLKTPALLDALDKAQAPATFFVVGSRAEAVSEILHRMAARGDEVENHSYTHPNMNLLIPSVAEGEILRTSVLIRALTGHSPHFFRPPGGNANAGVQKIARSYGLSLAYWTVDVLHAEDIGSSSGLIDYVLGHIHPGSIVLMHNGPDVTTASIPALVAALRAKGYTLVTLSKITEGKIAGKPTNKPMAMPKMRE